MSTRCSSIYLLCDYNEVVNGAEALIKYIQMKAEPTCVRVFDVFKNVQLEGSNTISHQLRYGLEDLLATDPNGALEAI